MKLKDKVAIVTGATKGIGVAIAKEYVKEGAKVVCTGRTVELGQQVVAELFKHPEGISEFLNGILQPKKIQICYTFFPKLLNR